ncbi:uncharacterized protein TRAVEDRAFT_43009 [Trametes versicolor FP-101664 SS1]|uniref:uncharacterized protein n=1 Tax=Trametes versicolor (strain FP-101664) TaxID=717944 RepID=UPI0004621D95|nr:uncharacterized protein TRAVEDRAFT_43009 [Trametes versicolor FP-101664 SS1]EIW62665.1 hypothetical protein TRAVEDRAFT_43009 [Trametes versicolor FP-101664 SS1]
MDVQINTGVAEDIKRSQEESESEIAYALAVEKYVLAPVHSFTSQRARFHEDGGADMMRWASTLGPVPAAQCAHDNIFSVQLVENTLALAKVASRIVWGIRSSMEQYKDIETDFVKIKTELQDAFNAVIDSLPGAKEPGIPAVTLPVPSDNGCIGAASSPEPPHPQSPQSDIYGISPGQIWSDCDYLPGQILSDHDYLPPASDSATTPHVYAPAPHMLNSTNGDPLPDSLTSTIHAAAHAFGKYLVDHLDQALDHRFGNLQHQLESTLSQSTADRLSPVVGHSRGRGGDDQVLLSTLDDSALEDACPELKRQRLS